MLGTATAWTALMLRNINPKDWLETYARGYWSIQVALAVLVLAQVAAWRGWSVWLRLLLHAGWIALVVWTRMRLP